MTIQTSTTVVVITKVRVRVFPKQLACWPRVLVVDHANPSVIVKNCTGLSSREIVEWSVENDLEIVNLVWLPNNGNQPVFKGE